MRALGFDPVDDTRRAFDGLLSAMSRPGTVHEVPAPADHAVVATLVDHEVTLATDDERLRDELAAQGRLDAASRDEADIVHARDHTRWDVRACKRGTLVEPSEGATIVYRVDGFENGTTVRVTGPGVDGQTTLTVKLPSTEIERLTSAQSGYPRGIDAVFAGENRVAALPRSVDVEVA